MKTTSPKNEGNLLQKMKTTSAKNLRRFTQNYVSLSHIFEILSQPGYFSDFHDQWLIWKLIAKTKRQSNNITVL